MTIGEALLFVFALAIGLASLVALLVVRSIERMVTLYLSPPPAPRRHSMRLSSIFGGGEAEATERPAGPERGFPAPAPDELEPEGEGVDGADLGAQLGAASEGLFQQQVDDWVEERRQEGVSDEDILAELKGRTVQVMD